MRWQDCKNILCIRPDNMGDLIMTGPAIRALKDSFGSKITVLTSSMAKGVIKHMPEIDDAIIFDLPWVKTAGTQNVNNLGGLIKELKDRRFDAAVIFTVYSQNPISTAMLAYMAGIPKILAYCRENPYHLISDWVPDKEPYNCVKHQVRRDLDLVATIGAFTGDEHLHLQVNEALWGPIEQKLIAAGVNVTRPWLIMHAGVSEKKREYPVERWVDAARGLINEQHYQILFTGSSSETSLTDELATMTGEGSFGLGGILTLDEFICLVKHAPLMLSVNTGSVHIAASVDTPVVVLYAQTNPQHTPWNVENKVLPFPVAKDLVSRNEVISYVNNHLYNKPIQMPTTDDIVEAVKELLNRPALSIRPFPEKQH